jgi:hypothetical protein
MVPLPGCENRVLKGHGSNHAATGYSISGITVDRKQALKWLFSQEKATLHAPQEVYVYFDML